MPRIAVWPGGGAPLLLSPVKTTEARIDPVFALLVASRWIHFVSISIVFGSSFFWFYIGGRRASTSLRGLPVTTAGTMRLLRVGALLAAVSGVAWLAATIANVTDDPASVLDRETLRVFFFETPFGPPSLARLATSRDTRGGGRHALGPARGGVDGRRRGRRAAREPSLAGARRGSRHQPLRAHDDQRLRHPCRGRRGLGRRPFRPWLWRSRSDGDATRAASISWRDTRRWRSSPSA